MRKGKGVCVCVPERDRERGREKERGRTSSPSLHPGVKSMWKGEVVDPSKT